MDTAPHDGLIRLAGPADAADIARVQVTTWRVAYRGQMSDSYLQALDAARNEAMWTKNIADPSRFIFVAIAAGRLVGFCAFLPARDADAGPHVGEISALYVDPEQWRGGWGTALLNRTAELARERGFGELTLWVLAGNTLARAFYAACGFVPDGSTQSKRMPGFDQDEVRYRRRLAG